LLAELVQIAAQGLCFLIATASGVSSQCTVCAGGATKVTTATLNEMLA